MSPLPMWWLMLYYYMDRNFRIFLINVFPELVPLGFSNTWQNLFLIKLGSITHSNFFITKNVFGEGGILKLPHKSERLSWARGKIYLWERESLNQMSNQKTQSTVHQSDCSCPWLGKTSILTVTQLAIQSFTQQTFIERLLLYAKYWTRLKTKHSVPFLWV